MSKLKAQRAKIKKQLLKACGVKVKDLKTDCLYTNEILRMRAFSDRRGSGSTPDLGFDSRNAHYGGVVDKL